MSHPDQPDEHGRTTGGVRGAINDLLGRGDTADRTDRTDDDRRAESGHLAQERSEAGHDAGTGAPTGARFDGQPVDDRTGADPRPSTEQPTGAPTGARFEGQHADLRGATDQHTGQPPAPTGARFDGQPVDQQQRGSGAGVVGAAAPEQHGAGERLGGPAAGSTPGSARHNDVGPDGPGYTAPAGARTVDVGGRAVTDPAASTGPVATDRAVAGRTPDDRTTDDRTPDDRPTDDRTAGNSGHAAAAGASTTPAGSGAGAVAQTSQGEDSSGRERLVSTDRAESYGSRWDAVKGQFVDEPRKAVADADALVGELLDELQTLFTEQRKGIERSMAADETSTEDMRLALRRYRSFFDRLLSI